MYDTVIIGGGPSGIMAALTAKNESNSILLLEKNSQLGKKLLLSGGGRCNITNFKDNASFIRELPIDNAKFLYSSLSNFGPYDIYSYFFEHNVPLKIEDNDRVFPESNKAIDILTLFHEQLKKNGIEVRCNYDCQKIVKINNYYLINDSIMAKNLVIATGGKSYPHTGSDGFGYLIAKQFHHQISPLYPSETPLLSNHPIKELQGITLHDISLQYNKKQVFGSMIFTHFGLSGPAALKMSNYILDDLNEQPRTIYLDVLPNTRESIFKDQLIQWRDIYPNKEINSCLKGTSINRFTDYILTRLSLSKKKITSISNKQFDEIISLYKSFPIEINGVKSIKHAFVTGGGVTLDSINPKTMESKLIQHLFFVGETLNLHGHTGGYNITIALSTGYTAGLAIKNMEN